MCTLSSINSHNFNWTHALLLHSYLVHLCSDASSAWEGALPWEHAEEWAYVPEWDTAKD